MLRTQDSAYRTVVAYAVMFCLQITTIATRADQPLSNHSAKIPASVQSAILVAWQTRQERTESLCVEWDETFTMGKGAMGVVESLIPGVPKGGPQPPRDVTLSGHCKLLVDGPSGRYSELREQWSTQKQKVVKQEEIQICRNGERRQLFPQSGLDNPMATVAQDATLADLLSIDGALPISLCYRILDPGFKVFEVKGMKLRDLPVLHHGRKLIAASFVHGRGYVELWLTADNEYMPVRYLVVNSEGRTTYDLDIEFAQSNTLGFVPARWTSKSLGPKGELRGVRRITVTALTFNDEIGSDEFELVFPSGTWVNDNTEGVSYIVLPNGTKRVLLPHETARDYDRILESASRWSAYDFLVLATVLLISGVAVRWMWLRRRRAY